MNWMQELYNTYEKCSGNKNVKGSDDLCPVGYSIQKAHIEVVLNSKGKFRRARLVEKQDNPSTFIPVTEESSNRTSGKAPHALCDSLQYCAGDYTKYGGVRPSYFNSYISQLREWAESEYSHPKVRAVYEYIKQGRLVEDLHAHDLLAVKDNVLLIDRKGKPDNQDVPIFKLMIYEPDKGEKDQAKVFVRWVVESDDENEKTWTDPSLFEAWRNFLDSQDVKKDLCCVSGRTAVIARNHPAKLRSGGDKRKLISSNDTSGYTFRGRFTSAEQVIAVSSEVTQKAHSALRWLISRKHAYQNDTQIIIAWEVSGKDIPLLFENSANLINSSEETLYEGDVKQAFVTRLRKKIAGYQASVTDTDDVVVMGLDSAVLGRMAIIFYRELKGSEFLSRIEKWHEQYAWIQNYGKKLHFTGAPAPRDITWAVYGKNAEGKNGSKLMNATIQRILPCIVDGTQIPFVLVRSAVIRATNRVGLEYWEWEKCLGIACALYKGFYKERRYDMSLEENRTTRDYLYGRLLALAETIESTALYYAKENRGTTVERLMQRFSSRPCSTWKTIEEALKPYESRIRSRTPGLLMGYKELLDDIKDKFNTEDFIRDESLSGEYLLAYHCQRRWLREHQRKDGKWILRSENSTEEDNEGINQLEGRSE